jgi:hypothetical protein
MHVPLSHIIGTIAIIAVVIGATLAYTIITSYAEANVLKTQLTQIAENISLNLVEIISLTNFGNVFTNETMMKTLNLPTDLANRAYFIQLIADTQGYYVQTELVVRTDITAKSPIPLNSTQTQLVIMTNGTDTLQVRGGDQGTIQCYPLIYGGRENIVVWGWKENSNTTRAGIGVWQPPGGP